MGLIAHLKQRRHVWSWRLRYWWLDTPGGAQAHVIVFCFSTLVLIADFVHMGIKALAPRSAGEPQQAVIWWVVYLIVALVAAAVSIALRPKTPSQPTSEAQGPTTEDGQSVVRYWGTHWIEDEFLLAWKIVGRDPIKADGGK